MKTTELFQIRTLATVALAASLSLTSLSRAASVVGSKHDLKALTNAGGQVCIACHTPHNAQATQLVPLWNHTASTTTFTLYSSPTSKAVFAQPAGATKACLSCHDGTVAIDSFGGKAPAGGGMVTSGSNLGTSLANDHPVSFTYDAALATATANGKLVSPSSASWVDSAKTVPLFAGKLECASCHDAHDNSLGNFLRKSNNGSALCLTCHNQ
jgi:predicted CXXCH cytochrome family protein